MSETVVAGGWLVSKLAPAIGGLFGGLSLAMFWTPEKLREKGTVASVFIAGGISAMAGFSFTHGVASYLGIVGDKIDVIIGLAWLLGLCSVAVMNWIANFMSKRENMDIAEIAEELNSTRKRIQGGTPRKRAPVRRKPK